MGNATNPRNPKRQRCEPMAPAAAVAGGRDGISALPDDLRGAILTLLPLKEAARTAALSSHWRHVWSQHAPLNLHLRIFSDPSCVVPSISDVLARHSGPVSFLWIEDLSSSEMGSRTLELLEGKRIQTLHYLAFSSWDRKLPQCLLRHGTLLSLKMSYCWFRNPAAALPCLMHLKDLTLCSIPGIEGKDFSALISGLPMLASLYLHGQPLSSPKLSEFHIHSKSLQRLSLWSIDGGTLSLDAPNIQELDVRYMHALWMDLESTVSNLSKLHCLKLACLYDVNSLHIRSTSLKILKLSSLKNVASLRISSMSLEILHMSLLSSVTEPVIHAPNIAMLKIKYLRITGEYFSKMLLGFPILRSLNINSRMHFAKFHLTSGTLESVRMHGDILIEEDLLIDAPCLQKVNIDSRTFACTNVKVINSPRLKDLGCLCSHPQMLELGDCIFKDVDLSCHNPILGIRTLTVNLANVSPLVAQLPKFFKCFPRLETLHIWETYYFRQDLENAENAQADLPHEMEGGQDDQHLHNHLMSFHLHLVRYEKCTIHLVRFILSQVRSLQRLHILLNSHRFAQDQYSQYLDYVSDIKEFVDPVILRTHWPQESVEF